MFKTILPLAVLMMAGATSAFGQLGVGLKLGAPLNDALKADSPNFLTSSERWTIGPYVEVELPSGVAIEADLLYRNHSYAVAGASGETDSGSSWEIPVLLKKKTSLPFVRPYVEVGASFARLSDVRFTTLANRNNYGVVLGGGLEFNLLLIKFSPEIRYTRWGKSAFGEGFDFEQNQFAVLFGIGF